MPSLQFLTSLFGETEGPCHNPNAENIKLQIFPQYAHNHKEPEYAKEIKYLDYNKHHYMANCYHQARDQRKLCLVFITETSSPRNQAWTKIIAKLRHLQLTSFSFLHISLSHVIHEIHDSLYTMGLRKKSRKSQIYNMVISNFVRNTVLSISNSLVTT